MLQNVFPSLVSQLAIREAIGSLVAVAIMAIILISAIRIVREYERAVVLRLGRLIGEGSGIDISHSNCR